jgi:hypothetical protein
MLIGDVRTTSFDRAWANMENEHWMDTRRDDIPRQGSDSEKRLAELVDEIDATLPDDEVDLETVRDFESQKWSIGSELVVLAPYKILRGFLVPVLEVPTLVPITLKLFALIRINGVRDWLVRENHGFGYHYHYVLADKRRTTTMLCWDTRWQSSVKDEPKGLNYRPLCHQLHNDSSKNILATPGAWGDKKRKSVRNACVPDLRRRSMADFLSAARDAEVVWPRSAVATR